MRFHAFTPQAIFRATCLAIVATLAAATMASITRAADLNPAHVPVDAKWLIHIDQEALSDLELTKELRETYPQITRAVRGWFKDRYGIDPQEGLRSLTMFSRDYRIHTGTVILETEYNEQKLKSRLHEEDSLKKTEWKGHTLYTVTLAKHRDDAKHAAHHKSKHGDAKSHRKMDHGTASDGHDESGGKQMTVWLGDQMIVLASSVPNAKSILRLLEGDAQSLEGTNSPLIAQAPDGSMIYGAAIELGRLDQFRMLLPLMQQQEQCVYAFGQRDEKLFETVTLTSQSEEVAKKTTEVLEGLIAYEQLCAAGSEPLTELMKNVKLSRNGTKSTVSWEGESKLVVDALVDLKARTDEWLKRFAQPLQATLKLTPLMDKGGPSIRQDDQEPSTEDDVNKLEQPRERRLARHAWLGVMIRTAADAGVEIARIYLDSPADKAGLKAGDRITRIDGTSVSSPQAVAQYIARIEPDTEIDVTVKRDGEQLTFEVEVGNLEDVHERLFGKRFRRKFDDFHEMFDPDFDGVPEGVFSLRIPTSDDDELTLREILREMREELREFRREFRQSNGDERELSNEQNGAASPEG
jgi:hypothetical protein